jgi:hypothetical protein
MTVRQRRLPHARARVAKAKRKKIGLGCSQTCPTDRLLAYDLDAMIDSVTPANRHSETDWGRPVGKEVW